MTSTQNLSPPEASEDAPEPEPAIPAAGTSPAAPPGPVAPAETQPPARRRKSLREAFYYWVMSRS